jgi:DNA ligase 1
LKTFADAIEAAERIGTRDGKAKALTGIDHSQRRLVYEALNRHRRFHVQQWDGPKRFSDRDVSIVVFYKLLDDLADRKITGDEARSAVVETLGRYTKRTAQYLSRVIVKDLDCGADEKTFRKIYPEMKLPNFSVMLAKKVDDKKFKWKFPCIAEVKYDGERVVAFVSLERKTVNYFSRSGRSKNFMCGGLFDRELIRMATEVGSSVMVDGELMGKSFQDTLQARKADSDKRSALQFHAFDFLLADEWLSRRCKATQEQRSKILEGLVKRFGGDKIIKSLYRIIHSEKDAKKFFKEVVKDGYEGLIIKDPQACYEWDRSASWLKWKPVYSADLKIVKVKRGKMSGRFRNTCGSLRLRGEDENGNRIKTDCAGLDDEMRDWFWKRRKRVIGMIVEVAYDGMTKAKGADTYALRFARFIRIRDDK